MLSTYAYFLFALFLYKSTDYEPCVHGYGRYQTIMVAHNVETFFQRVAVVLRRVTTIEKIGYYGVYAAVRQTASFALLQNLYAPVDIGRMTVAGVVGYIFGNVA